LPARIKAALAANDRLKLSLTMLRAAAEHASDRKRGIAQLNPGGREILPPGMHD
jgi:hypothetical protein